MFLKFFSIPTLFRLSICNSSSIAFFIIIYSSIVLLYKVLVCSGACGCEKCFSPSSQNCLKSGFNLVSSVTIVVGSSEGMSCPGVGAAPAGMVREQVTLMKCLYKLLKCYTDIFAIIINYYP